MKNLSDIQNFREIQEELAYVTSKIELESAELVKAREARDTLLAIHDNKYDEAWAKEKEKSPRSGAEAISNLARIAVVEDRQTAGIAERELQSHRTVMDCLERRLRAIEILSNNMRAELKNLRGVPA